MAIPITIDKLLNDHIVEDARIELKQNWNPEEVLRTICAFANDIDNWGGGYIVLGVKEENGRPVFPVTGITKGSVDSIHKELLQLCNFIEPRYIPVSEPAEFQGKQLLVIWAPGGYDRPYKCPADPYAKRITKKYYIRKLASTIEAKNAEERELLSLADNVPFDDRINQRSNIEDLKTNLIIQFLASTGSALYPTAASRRIEDLAMDLRIADGPAEYFKPLNVGLMFFSYDIERYFRYARIEYTFLPDPTGAGMIEKNFTGPLDGQLRDALLYIRNSVIEEKTFKLKDQAQAVRVSNYPYPAVEEILCNAVYHKSYQIHEPISIRVTEDAFEITSFPGFDRSISDEDIKKYHIVARRYRNRRIGDFLKELKLIEGKNTGIPTAVKACLDNGSKLPVFIMDDERTYLTVRFEINSNFAQNQKQETSAHQKRRTRDELEQEVLSELHQENYSLRELAHQLGYRSVSKTLSDVVDGLRDEGKVAYTAKEKNSSRQKLCLK